MNRVFKFWSALLFLFSGTMLLWFASQNSASREPQSIVDDQQAESSDAPLNREPLEHFQLINQSGLKFDSKALDGKIWVGSVFFSTCPSTCRMQNMRVAKLQQEFGADGVEFVSITCDPERDTVATLAEYSQIFGAKPDRWHFLTGDFDLIRRIGNEKLGIVVQPETHSDRLVLFDRNGENVGAYRSTQTEDFEKMRNHIGKLLGKDRVAVDRTEVESMTDEDGSQTQSE